MKNQTVMLVSCLTLILLSSVGPARAIETTTAEQPAEISDGSVSLVVGRVAKIDGQSFVVEEVDGGSVQVRIAPETHGHTALKVGERVLVSLLPSGVASIITGEEVAAGSEPLRVGEPGAR